MNGTESNWQHPADGWYQIEAKGEHLNKRAGVIQVIDDTACASIVNRFNRDAAKPGFPGMLIDHEHFKHDDDKETRAYGWLMRLENRADGIYGQIRWSKTGKDAVDGGEYRQFSTEYDPKDLEVLNNGKPRRIRPLALDGLTLTNVNNNKGQKPITNRDDLIKNRQQSNFMNQTPSVPSSAQLRVQATNTARLTGRSFESCWNDLRIANPESFGVRNREEVDAERRDAMLAIHNRVVEEAERRESQAKVYLRPYPWTEQDEVDLAMAQTEATQAARVENRCSFAEGRNIARRLHPELFPSGWEEPPEPVCNTPRPSYGAPVAVRSRMHIVRGR